MQVEQTAVLEALKAVRDPDLNRDIVSLGFIKGLAIDSGRVSFTIELTTPACPVKDQMRDQARAAVLRVPGVSAVDVQLSARALQQFFREVRWVDLDYLVVDLPPGTGDVALSLSQTVPVAGAIIVTTPQQVSLADSRRAAAMYRKLNIPPLGIIENMSYFACPECRHEADIFGHGGGEQMAADLSLPFIGRIPIYQPIREGSDAGVPLMISEPESPAARAFMSAAERTAAQVSIASYNRPTIPLTVVR